MIIGSVQSLFMVPGGGGKAPGVHVQGHAIFFPPSFRVFARIDFTDQGQAKKKGAKSIKKRKHMLVQTPPGC
jgi:hypothetical protein